MFACERCHNLTMNENGIHTWSGGGILHVCTECYDEIHPSIPWTQCDGCSEKYDALLTTSINARHGNITVRQNFCSDCFHDNFVKCDGCQKFVARSDVSERFGNGIYCRECVEAIDQGTRRLQCEACNIFYIPRTVQQSVEHLCSSCCHQYDDDDFHQYDDDNDYRGMPDDTTITFKKNDDTDAIVNDARSEI